MSNLILPQKEEFIDNWNTNWGLIIYNIYIILGSSVIGVSLIEIGLITPYFPRVLILVPNLVFLICWIFKRIYWGIVFSKKLNVVFALDLKNNSKKTIKIYKEVLENLKNRILEMNLENIISIKEKSEDVKFKSKDVAEIKTKMGLPGSVLLIWGNITEKSKTFKLFFSYEFGYPGKEREYYRNIFRKEIDKIFAKKLWSYKGPNSVEILSQDFLEVTCFIFGLIMATLGRFDESITLLTSFGDEWTKSSDLIKKRNLGPALKEADGILARIYLYYSEMYRYEDYEKMKIYAQKALDSNYNNETNYSALLCLAVYSEEGANDIEKAKEYNEKAADIHPAKKELHLFNKAYFCLNDYDFESALEIYDDLAKYQPETNYNIIRDSLIKKYLKTKNLGFLFAEIYIAYLFQDDVFYYKKEIRKFIESTRNEEKYNVLISKANNILEEL